MDARQMQSHSQREDEKASLQSKSSTANVENEITLTIQGQRAVQDIVDKASELFRRLQSFRLTADSTSSRQSQMHISREIRDALNTMKLLFAKLRKVYDETNSRLGLKTEDGVKDIIPFKSEEKEVKMETNIDDSLTKEHQQLQKTLREKNAKIQELMTTLRTMIWDINTMIALKPS